jgi:hypothetical protein
MNKGSIIIKPIPMNAKIKLRSERTIEKIKKNNLFCLFTLASNDKHAKKKKI